ncbi:uncharacterized protein, partial [Watersipora subatra]|uniref:uncharacterized protein n=1 Tax=Watersipora subatra TaxID=2589382 RepID=UPI00355B708E
MRGDERTRPDILSPATEDCTGDVGSASRSSSAVMHSPTGAFEPVRGSASRTGSLSESEHSMPLPHYAGTTAAPLWEQPTLPPVQLQPASNMYGSALPVQVLSSQMLQSFGAEAIPQAGKVDDNTVNDLSQHLDSVTLQDTQNTVSGGLQASVSASYPHFGAVNSSQTSVASYESTLGQQPSAPQPPTPLYEATQDAP